MSSRTVAAPPDSVEPPLAGFSQCHVGITRQLDAFAELPALHTAALRAREVAAATVALFEEAVIAHHADEEGELFPAVLRSAAPGQEAAEVEVMVRQLTAEHRQIEARWKALAPAVRAAARSKPVDFDVAAVQALVAAYHAHAGFEEQHFLPAAQRILGRNDNHMAALGLSLHMRHAPPVVGYI